MQNNDNPKNYNLTFVIVNYGNGSKVIKAARENGITGCTIFLGKGTIKNALLEFFGVTDIRKEIILMVADEELSNHAILELNKKFHFEKPNHGIAFSLNVPNVLGLRNCSYNKSYESRGVDNIMYNAIFTIVDKGNAEAVVDVAVEAGSRGGTIINARGAGLHEYSMLFSMPIEPEKEIVMILSEKDLTEQIVQAIRNEMKIDEPGKGLLFTLDINKTLGLY